MKPVLYRLIRSALAIFWAGLIAKYANEPAFIALAPFFSALGKYLRDKFEWEWVPF